MKELTTLFALIVLQGTLLAQDIPVPKAKSSPAGFESQTIKNERKHYIYIGPSVFLDEPFNFEPFVGTHLSYDLRIHALGKRFRTGVSASIGRIEGSSGRYSQGPFFKIGPKVFLGGSRKCGTVGLQYFQFREVGGIVFHGVNIGIGVVLAGKRGFFFHPKIEYQYSSSRERNAYPDPPLSNMEIGFGLGYSF